MIKLFNILKTAIRETDLTLLALCILTSVFGITMVYSATLPTLSEGSVISRDAKTMLIAVIAGLVVAVGISFIDYKFITRMSPFIGAFCLLLMLATLLFGVGPAERPDAKTWLVLGSSGLYFQASELMKIGFIITFGMHIELVRDRLTEIKQLLLLAVHGMIPVGIVSLSGDMGSALVFLVIFAVMLFCAGVGLRYFIAGAALIAAAVPAAWTFVLSDTQKNRFLGLLYPERYPDIMYQQQNGIKAIISGGLTGKGLFHGAYTQTNDLIPELENDMIFAAIGEELGLLGCVAAILLLVGIIAKIMYTGHRSKGEGTSLMCYGFAAMIAGQIIINIGMVLVIMPVIGITLPFFSAGGSSNLCLYIGIGLMLSIYRFDKERQITDFRLTSIVRS